MQHKVVELDTELLMRQARDIAEEEYEGLIHEMATYIYETVVELGMSVEDAAEAARSAL